MYKFIRVCKMCGAAIRLGMEWDGPLWNVRRETKKWQEIVDSIDLFCEFVCV